MTYRVEVDGKVRSIHKTEARAFEFGRRLVERGIYNTVRCTERIPGTIARYQTVWSSNEHNWLGSNGHWNTNE
jgi:hypothetical protein